MSLNFILIQTFLNYTKMNAFAISSKLNTPRLWKNSPISSFIGLTILFIISVFYSQNSNAQTVTYQHTDVLGSVVAESNENGTVISRYYYQPFGKRIESEKEGIGYTGHVHDKDLELIYMQARYYDPLIGRFYSNDPVDALGHIQRGNPLHGFNRYAYANNNPYRYVDPDGKAAESWLNRPGGVSIGQHQKAMGKAGGGVARGPVGAAVQIAFIVAQAASDLPSDRSGQEGTSDEMDDFESELDSISTPGKTDKTKIRSLNPGVKAKDVVGKAPGKSRSDGGKDTAEGGYVGTHNSSRTPGNPATVDVHRPNSRPKKYREHQE